MILNIGIDKIMTNYSLKNKTTIFNVMLFKIDKYL